MDFWDEELRRIESIDDPDEAQAAIIALGKRVDAAKSTINDRVKAKREDEYAPVIADLQQMDTLPRGKAGRDALAERHGLSVWRAQYLITKERDRRRRQEREQWDRAEEQAHTEAREKYGAQDWTGNRWGDEVYDEIERRIDELMQSEDA